MLTKDCTIITASFAAPGKILLQPRPASAQAPTLQSQNVQKRKNNFSSVYFSDLDSWKGGWKKL
jgi:hypothetical protein